MPSCCGKVQCPSTYTGKATHCVTNYVTYANFAVAAFVGTYALFLGSKAEQNDGNYKVGIVPIKALGYGLGFGVIATSVVINNYDAIRDYIFNDKQDINNKENPNSDNISNNQQHSQCHTSQTKNNVDYQPVVCSIEKAVNEGFVEITTSNKMLGDSEKNNILKASSEGSHIFARGGLNYIVANEGADNFYFSLCSTKIIDGFVPVIEGFDANKDLIHFFCTKRIIRADDINIREVEHGTYVEVKGNDDTSVVYLLGVHNFSKELIEYQKIYVFNYEDHKCIAERAIDGVVSNCVLEL
jgi:hypothetical protein